MKLFKRKPKKLYRLTFEEIFGGQKFTNYFVIKAKNANKAIEYWYKKHKELHYSNYNLQNVEVIDWSDK